MKDFEETIQKHFNTLLTELKKCKSKKKYIELISIYYIIDEIIKNTQLDIKYCQEFEYELNKFNTDKYDKSYDLMYMNNYYLMHDYNVKISNIYKHIHFSIFNTIEYKEYVQIDESIKLIQSFFKYYSDDLYNYFNNQILGNGLLILTDKVESGCTYLSNYIIPPYSFVNPKFCIKDFITIIHETTHSYIRNRLRFINFDQLNQMLVNNLEEVYPIFMELCAIKYCEDNKYYKDINEYKKAMYSSLYYYLENYNEDLMNGEINNYVKNESYSYGFLLAYKYFDMYNKNKDEAKKNVLKLSLDLPFYNKSYLLNNYGTNQLDLLNTSKYLNNIK